MPKFDRAMLWEIKSDKLPKSSYLFGTMHAKSAQAYVYFELAKKYLLLCDEFSGEIDLSVIGSEANSIMMPMDFNFEEYVGIKKFQKLEKKVKKYFNVSLSDFKHFKPMITLNILQESSMQNEHTYALDFELKELAQANGLTLSGIESFQEQQAIFNAISVDDQVNMFVKMLKNISKSNKSFQKILKYYDKAALNAMYKISLKSLGAQKKLLLLDRNKIMAERIFNKIQDSHCFVAIGAAHLGGSKGVLNLLSKKGLELRPVIQ